MSQDTQQSVPNLVSVIIPTRNRQELLGRAVESVLSQTYEAFEVIIADDASDDDTQSVCEDLAKKDSRIRLYKSENNIGAAMIRNIAAELANGEFICFLDDDDEWLPCKLSKQLAAIGSYPLIGAILKRADGYTVWGRSSLHKLYNRSVARKRPTQEVTELTINDIFFDNGRISPSSMMVRTEKFRGVGGFDESLVASQGRDLLVRIVLKYGGIARINSVLSKQYQQHGLVRISTTRNHLVGGWNEFNKHRQHMPIHLQNWRQFILCIREANFSGSLTLRIQWIGRSLRYVRSRYLLKHIKFLVVTQFVR